MVTVVEIAERKSREGKEYFALVVQGGVEMVQSKISKRYYATARKATIATTFPKEFCQTLVGKEIPGEIMRIDVEPYEFEIPETKEKITLTHSFMFVPEGEKVNAKTVKQGVKVF